jgi:striatin 1/3/4
LFTKTSFKNNNCVGHTDAVWGLALHPSKGQLLSCSADGTVRLWQPTQTTHPQLNNFALAEHDGMPTCVDFIRTETSPVQMVVGFRTGVAVVYDVETGKPVIRLDTNVVSKQILLF